MDRVSSFSLPEELNLLDILGSIKRRFYLVAGFTVLFLLFGLLIVTVSPVKYRAEARIALDLSGKQMGMAAYPAVGQVQGQTMLLPSTDAVLLSQVEMLQSPHLAEQLVSELKLSRDPAFWHKSRVPADESVARQRASFLITQNISVRQISRSLVIEVGYRHTDPVLAAKIVNRYVELFQENQIKSKITQSHEQVQWLEKRLENLAAKLRQSARAVEEYRSREDLIDGAKAEITSQQITDISSQLMQAQAEEAGILARKEQMEERAKENKEFVHAAQDEQSSLLVLLKRDEVALNAQLAQLQTKYGPNHPRILATQSELREVKRRKAEEAGKLSRQTDQEALTIAAKIALLKKNLKEAEDKRRRENQAAIGLRELQGEADANRDLYQAFLARYKEARMTGDTQSPDTTIISLAKIPQLAHGPSPILIISLCSLGGFVFGVLIVLLLEQMDRRIRNPEQLLALTGQETFGIIPEFKDRKAEEEPYVFRHPFSEVTEALRHCCLRILGNLKTTPVVISISAGPLPQDRNSRQEQAFLVLNLASLMAKSGLNVRVIDGYLRHPRFISKDDTRTSLAEVIVKAGDVDTIAKPYPNNPALTVLSGQLGQTEDIIRLSKTHLKNFIARAKSGQDVVLIHTPSFDIAEAQLFNRVADMRLMVVPYDRIAAKSVSTVFHRMRHDQHPLTGFIMTGYPH